MTTPDDFGLAATGDLSALRRLRDCLFDLAVGRICHAVIQDGCLGESLSNAAVSSR